MANPDENAAPSTAEEKTPELKTIKYDGYEFECDTDLIDDVEGLDIIHQIEDKGRISAIVPLLHFIMSDDEYNKLSQYFIQKDADEHKGVKGYRPRFRATKLSGLYTAIIEQYNPKG